MAEEAFFDTRELVEALQPERDPDFFPLNDLPNDVLVSIFMAVGDLRWARHTVPRVCKAWNELYLSKDASPLHETLEVDFWEEAVAARKGGGRRDRVEGAPPAFVVHGSRVVSWAQGRASSVRKLRLEGGAFSFHVALDDFSSEELGALVAVVGPSLTDISIGPSLGSLCRRPFWESLRTSVVPAGRLRSLVVENIKSDLRESDVEPLGQLAGTLEELSLTTECDNAGLPRFPEALLALEKLRSLVLDVTAIPAGISSLKNLKDLALSCKPSSLPEGLFELSGLTRLSLNNSKDIQNLHGEEVPPALKKMASLRQLDLCGFDLRTLPALVGGLKSLEGLKFYFNDLSSLPKELGGLSKLTKLEFGHNENLGNRLPAAAAFPAELGKMKSLRELNLNSCGLRTVPAFVGGLESLEVLDLSYNDYLQFESTLDFLIEGCPRLREVRLHKWSDGVPWTPRSLAYIKAFKAKLRAKNPAAKVVLR